jgi:hypothetical protein
MSKSKRKSLINYNSGAKALNDLQGFVRLLILLSKNEQDGSAMQIVKDIAAQSNRSTRSTGDFQYRDQGN